MIQIMEIEGKIIMWFGMYPVSSFSSRYNEENFNVTNQLVTEVISLPMHTELDDEQIDFITSTVKAFVNG